MALCGILVTKVRPELGAAHKGVWLRGYGDTRKHGEELDLFQYMFLSGLHKEAGNRFLELPPVVCMFDTERYLVINLQVGEEAARAWRPEIDNLPVGNRV